MPVNFLDPETTFLSGKMKALKRAGASSSAEELGTIPSSGDVTGIEIRMLPPYIKDNNTPAIKPFLPGFARLYCLTIVVSDVNNQLAGNIDIKGFPRIGDREYLPLNKTIFYWQSQKKTDKPPAQVHIMCSVIKSKKDLRDVSAILTQVKSDENYKSLIGSLKNLAKNAARFSLVTDVITQVAGIVGNYLGKVEDKPLGTVINSYTTIHGDFDKLGVSPFTYPTRNVDFNFQVVVRSAAATDMLVRATVPAGVKRPVKKAAGIKTLPLVSEEVHVDMMPL